MKVIRKLFAHGGSYAIDLPMLFVKRSGSDEFVIEERENGLLIHPKNELDTIEGEPQFNSFVKALVHDALAHPESLHGPKDVWDSEWDELLRNVEEDDE